MPLIQDYNKLFEHTDDIKKVIFNGNIVWPTVKPTGPDYTEPFYVENISDADETLSIKKASSSAPTITIEYSTDKTNWDTLVTTSTTTFTRTITPGEKLYLKCSTNEWCTLGGSANQITGISKVGGNIMSLLYDYSFADKTSFPSGSSYNFYSLFYNNSRLIDASELLLPATTLASFCFSSMFSGCTSLSLAPALPATTLASYCYYNMFYYCTSLTTAPESPATTLAQRCYSRMFFGCTSLTTAPVLPATTLVTSCYESMFEGCTSLNNVICLATSGINENYSTNYWLYNVSSTGTFTKAAGITWPAGANGIPSGWTVVEV